MYFLEVYFKYTQAILIAPFQGSFASVDHLVVVVQLSVDDRVSVMTYF